MAAAQDFLQERLPDGDFGDLRIENGDFVVGPSDEQHIADIVMGVPGWIKQFPLVGADPYQYLKSRNKENEINQNIKIQLQADGYAVNDIKIETVGENLKVMHNATRV